MVPARARYLPPAAPLGTSAGSPRLLVSQALTVASRSPVARAASGKGDAGSRSLDEGSSVLGSELGGAHLALSPRREILGWRCRIKGLRSSSERSSAMRRGALENASDCFTDDVEWHNTAEFPGPRELVGREALVRFWAELLEPWSIGGEPIEEIRTGEDRVVVAVYSWGEGRGSGIPMDQHWAIKLSPCGPGRSREWTPAAVSPRPLPPPDCRSRRCQRRTWNCFIGR